MQELLRRRERATFGGGDGELAARATLRAQIGRLERELGSLVGEGFGRVAVPHEVAALAATPRVLDLGELERLRDTLVDQAAAARRALAERALYEERNRARLRALLEAPERHAGLAITREEVGEPGCGGWRSAPRCGPLGRLMGWWRVKVSSGCPLAGRPAAVEREVEAGGTAPA
jgi:hypothetical protein